MNKAHITDPAPYCRTSRDYKKSVNLENGGYEEEQIHRERVKWHLPESKRSQNPRSKRCIAVIHCCEKSVFIPISFAIASILNNLIYMCVKIIYSK
jgi:hypothetical protein